MLAKRRCMRLGGREIVETPLLLPSFSSKGFQDVGAILETTKPVLDAEILVSAYDIHFGALSDDFEFAEVMFLDSGGYEASQDMDLSEVRSQRYEPRTWSREAYREVVGSWRCSRPTVVVSYDHPDERFSVDEQIRKATEGAATGSNLLNEILFKPTSAGSAFLDVQGIVEHAPLLAPFDAVGMTEKELGGTIIARMKNIATLRSALDGCGQHEKPIHVFGSLDTVSTPLYFVAGADIFDGLAWLRYAYHKGMTVYRQNFVAEEFGLDLDPQLADAACWSYNYRYLKSLQREMARFARTGCFQEFRHHAELIEKAFRSLSPKKET